jgi:hypothetical protein
MAATRAGHSGPTVLRHPIVVRRRYWPMHSAATCANRGSSLAPVSTTTSWTSYVSAAAASLADCGASPFWGLPFLYRFADVAPEHARLSVASTPAIAVSWISASSDRWQALPGRSVPGS